MPTMTKTSLKQLIKECIKEVFIDDYIQNLVRDTIKDKLVVEINVPSLGKTTNNSQSHPQESEPVVPTTPTSAQLNEVRSTLMKAVVSDDDVPDFSDKEKEIIAQGKKIWDKIK